MRASFDHFEDENDTIRTFWFKPERPMRYTAGQFTEVTLPHKHVDSRGLKRWFTLSSPPGSNLVSITTRHAAKDGSSFKHALWALKRGNEADLAEAMGDFVLPMLIQTPVIFVAGGIGITPFHSIAAWLNETKERRPIRFLHAVQREEDIIFSRTFERAGIEIVSIVTDPSSSWGGERGRINARMILGLEKPTADTLIYLSGPEPMLEALQKDLLADGVESRQIITDCFPGYTTL